MVTHVLDVATGADLCEAGSGHRAKGLTLLKDQVTVLLDLADIPAIPVLPGVLAYHSAEALS